MRPIQHCESQSVMQARVVSEFKRWTTLMSAADRGNEQEVAAVLAEGDCHLYRKTKVSRFERCFLLNNHACRVLSGDSIANRSPPQETPIFVTPTSWWCPTSILRPSVVCGPDSRTYGLIVCVESYLSVCQTHIILSALGAAIAIPYFD